LLDFAIAKSKIEARRVQASKWTIEELPVVVIVGQNDSLIIGEINTTEPLSVFLPLRKHLLGLEQLGQHFTPPRANSVFLLSQHSHFPSTVAV